mmetsp:Transcript_21834/g.24905  ORF Transcript_21834/g.24905 Transcript_21834/m.24905 type:complete len:96 (-) Transcript_21834:75-362(-)
MSCCTLEIKRLNGEFNILENISLQLTVGELYDRVEQDIIPDGKWKMMLIIKSPRTLKPIQDKDKTLLDYGAVDDQRYRVEVILDMGACHTSGRRN